MGRWARSAGEFLSVAAALSFLLSVWANQLIFDRWGLQFLQLATLPDVVTSGVGLLSWVLMVGVLFGIAYGIGRLRGWARWLRYVLALLAVVQGALGVLMLAMRLEEGAYAVHLSGVVLIALLLPGALHARRHPSRGGAVRQAAVVALLLVSPAALLHTVVTGYEETGYEGEHLHLAAPARPGCVGHLLWSGERALVISCAEVSEEAPPAVTVVHQPQGWAFDRVEVEEPREARRGEREKGSR